MSDTNTRSAELISSVEWWRRTKSNPDKIIEWLKNQYHGERTAAIRLAQFRDAFVSEMTPDQISIIAEQEDAHAVWVGELLAKRGQAPQLLHKRERYWDKTTSQVTSFDLGAAVAAHAEEMRLERIRAITSDESAPEDIRAVFVKILPQEEFHARAFRRMASAAALAQTEGQHRLAREALGLEA